MKYVILITEKENAANVSSDMFAAVHDQELMRKVETHSKAIYYVHINPKRRENTRNYCLPDKSHL